MGQKPPLGGKAPPFAILRPKSLTTGRLCHRPLLGMVLQCTNSREISYSLLHSLNINTSLNITMDRWMRCFCCEMQSSMDLISNFYQRFIFRLVYCWCHVVSMLFSKAIWKLLAQMVLLTTQTNI
jgi:hypothetical protein